MNKNKLTENNFYKTFGTNTTTDLANVNYSEK